MKTFKSTENNQKQIEFCLTSDLSNMIFEFELGRLTKESIFEYFVDFLVSANVDSEIIVNVLEKEQFGDLGKDEARDIKVSEGW